MTTTYTSQEFDTAKSCDYLTLQCDHCTGPFQRLKKHIQTAIKQGSPALYCSKTCHHANRNNAKAYSCLHCNKEVFKRPSDLTKSGNVFCNHSCAASYGNVNKTTGTRRSKLETWLEAKLLTVYPELEVLYCDKTAIRSELDIYFPSLSLAFELNGIYHYEPIHGQSKLDQVQNNDNRKFQACLEKGIELVIVDTSHLKYFKEANCQKYLDIIKMIVDSKLSKLPD